MSTPCLLARPVAILRIYTVNPDGSKGMLFVTLRHLTERTALRTALLYNRAGYIATVRVS